MSTKDIKSLIAQAKQTGRPASDSLIYTLYASNEKERMDCIDESEIIDVTPININQSDNEHRCYPINQYNLQHLTPVHSTIDNHNHYNALTTHLALHKQTGISSIVMKLLREADKYEIPSDTISHQKKDISISILNWEFSKLSKEERLHFVEQFGKDPALTRLGHDGQITCNYETFENIISLVSSVLNRGPIKAALVVAQLLGIKIEYCFRTFPENGKIPPAVPINTSIHEDLPAILKTSKCYYLLTEIDYEFDFNGRKLQAILYYRDSENKFDDLFLIAERIDHKGIISLKIGRTDASARLYSHTMIAQHSTAVVIICLDMRIAMSLRKIAREARLFEKSNVIISGCYNGHSALKALNLKELLGHEVVIIPESTQESLDSIDDWTGRCEKAGATSVTIYPWPIIDDDSLPSFSEIGPWEQISRINNIERPSLLMKRIQERAMDSDAFKDWKKGKTKNDDPENIPTEYNTKFCIKYLPDIKDAKPLDIMHTLSVSDLFNLLNTSIIYGYSNAGKSFFVSELATSLSTGTPCFFLSAPIPSKVCYIGGEGSDVDFKSRCLQLMKNRAEYRDLLDKNLGCHVVKGGLDILDDNKQVEIVDSLLKEKIKYLFIDNLISLASESTTNNNSNKLFKFVNEIEKKGITAILIHHTGKDKKDHKGPVDLVSRCQNVLQLEGREQIMNEQNSSKALQNALTYDGPVTRLTVIKCKVAPHFERRSIIYRVPPSGTWELVEGDIINGHDTSDAHAINTSLKSFNNTSILDPHLPPDAEKILSVMDNNTSYYRSDLEKATGFKEDRIRKNLTLLIEAGLVIREGEGKGTYYRKA